MAIGAVLGTVWVLTAFIIIVRLVDGRHSSRFIPRNGASSTDAPYQMLRKMTSAAEAITRLGPSAGLVETRKAVVEAGHIAADSDLVALFMIDPCTGAIESESTPGISEPLQHAFCELFSKQMTDRENKDAWVVTNVARQNMPNPRAQQILITNNVNTIIACPVRSDASACGALVVFYGSEIEDPDQSARMVETVAAQASTALTYALSMEQSRCLLDDLAGVNQELSVQATVDGLTGLPNHRTFQQTLQDLCRKSAINKRALSMIMVDVDHFKLYNDTHGHPEGDLVLQKVAKAMSAGIRQGDFAARYGGEEFAIIFPASGKDEVVDIADQIRRNISEQTYGKGVVTVSMGVAEFPLDASTPSELIQCADKALYHAKVTGRNRVSAWGNSWPSTIPAVDMASEAARQRNILVVESADESCAGVLVNTLSALCQVELAGSMSDAVELLKTQEFDIALISLDVLPGRDTSPIATLAAVHSHMSIILTGGQISAQEGVEAIRHGASDVLIKPYNAAELPGVVERNIVRQKLELERLTTRGATLMLRAIQALVAAIDARDHYTASHSQKVAALAVAISDDLGLPSEERAALEFAARLHDVGKLCLPDSALNKHSALTEEEWNAMRKHPAAGAKIVGSISELAYVSTIIRHHHERLDGTGYPDGLRGQAIPYLSRIIAVADAYEALTSERAHRSRLTPAEAIVELMRHTDGQYQAEIVEVLRKQLIDRGELPGDSFNRAA